MSKIILNQQPPAYIANPVNLDKAIQELQRALKTNLAWLTVAFGRARVIPERNAGKVLQLPKVYYGSKEYANVLLNDTVNAQSWFQVMSPETPLDYQAMNTIQKYSVTVAAIFWVNLELINLTNADYYYLELLKRQAHNILGRYPNVTILRVYDENARDIFREYTTEVEKDQFLTHPKAGLRFEFQLTFNYSCIDESTSQASS